MRIAIDARIIYTTTGRYVERLLHHLQELDTINEYSVLLMAADFDRWQPTAPNFKKVLADYPIYSLAEQLRFGWTVYGTGADLVHFTMPQHPLVYMKPQVVTVHDLTLLDFVNKRPGNWLKRFLANHIKPLAFRFVLWAAIWKSKAVMVPTQFVREQLLSRFNAPPERVYVTYESADPLAAEAESIDLGQGNDYLIYVGNAYPYKNLGFLIEAFKKLNRPELKLVLVGKKDYFYEELERKTVADGTQGVIFAGFVPDPQLRWLFEHGTLYVFPSLSEGFGLPPLEAMQYGLPILSSNASCMPEVYGDAAVYFDPHNVDDLVQNIGSLLDDDQRRKQLGEAGREHVKQFSWRRMAEETLAIYKKALGQ